MTNLDAHGLVDGRGFDVRWRVIRRGPTRSDSGSGQGDPPKSSLVRMPPQSLSAACSKSSIAISWLASNEASNIQWCGRDGRRRLVDRATRLEVDGDGESESVAAHPRRGETGKDGPAEAQTLRSARVRDSDLQLMQESSDPFAR